MRKQENRRIEMIQQRKIRKNNKLNKEEQMLNSTVVLYDWLSKVRGEKKNKFIDFCFTSFLNFLEYLNTIIQQKDQLLLPKVGNIQIKRKKPVKNYLNKLQDYLIKNIIEWSIQNKYASQMGLQLVIFLCLCVMLLRIIVEKKVQQQYGQIIKQLLRIKIQYMLIYLL
ncbi:unnamed protein product [Paramecium pentaurelia]|uniref:Transmembrane protein n=1 Tax=Paramecium pentaurelia TaxID=43138 RepID=A0A8S1VFT2_9CILI|nr:unnamed protein product [Paramecium pentaurelia]